MSEIGNWIFFFFKEKITLKHSNAARSYEPRVGLSCNPVPEAKQRSNQDNGEESAKYTTENWIQAYD